MIEEERYDGNVVTKPVINPIAKTPRKKSKAGLIALMFLAFAILGALIILTQTFILLVSLASILSLAGYLLVSLKRQRKNPARKRMRAPFPILFALLVIPIVAASLYSHEQFNVRSIYSIVVAFGMTLTFMYTLINVPLAIYHERMTERVGFLYASPLVTIIIPAYNEERSIRKTLDSVIEASYPNKQVIVVDDGSTDNTFAIAQSYKDKLPADRFLLISRPNGGKSAAMNYAIRYAMGEYIIPIDADSVMARDSISEIVKYFQIPDVVEVGGNITVKNRNSLLNDFQDNDYNVCS